MAREIVSNSPPSSAMLRNFPLVTLRLPSVRSRLSSKSGSLSMRLSSYVLTSRSDPSKIPASTSARVTRDGSHWSEA